jgi:uncharacterized protein with FMN-binding domain
MNKKNIKTIGILIFVVIIGFGVFYLTNILPANRVLEEVRNAEIKDIDLGKVADGRYAGEFSYSRTNCKVEVIVRDHRIEGINVLENGTSAYAKKAEGVISRVIEQNKTNVDVVSGATTTSKALLKAVEAALSSGL